MAHRSEASAAASYCWLKTLLGAWLWISSAVVAGGGQADGAGRVVEPTPRQRTARFPARRTVRRAPSGQARTAHPGHPAADAFEVMNSEAAKMGLWPLRPQAHSAFTQSSVTNCVGSGYVDGTPGDATGPPASIREATAKFNSSSCAKMSLRGEKP